MMNAQQATVLRLSEMLDTFRSGLSDLTGRARTAVIGIGEGAGHKTEYIGGRFGGVKKAFPELRHVKETPSRIAAAIERGSGPLYARVYGTVFDEMSKTFPVGGRRRVERPTIPAHDALTAKCKKCGVPHGKNEHRFHGRGSWLRTHLFPFKVNPMSWTVKKAGQAVTYYTGLIARGIPLSRQERQILTEARQFLRRVRQRRNPGAKKKSPGRVRIYGRLLRIEAQKTGKHRCDAGCRKANHCYFHDFGPGAVVYGMPDGTLRIVSSKGKKLWNWF